MMHNGDGPTSRDVGTAPMNLDGSRLDVIVRVISPFYDAQTEKYFDRGDVVVGWSAERAAWFAEQGLVVVMRTDDRGPGTGDGASASRPGPKETKPGDGPVVRKERD